jgi:hypothetical protein
VGVPVSLHGGAVGGVLAAPTIARRTLAAHRQRAAEDTIVNALCGYRNLLRHQDGQLYEFDKFPSS